MSHTLPPELWEYIIRDYNLYGLKNMKTIKMIPSRHCIIRTVYNPLIQPYIDHMCKLFYSLTSDIINKSYIFNKYNLIDIIEYFDIIIEDLAKIYINYHIYNNINIYDTIRLEYKNKIVRINIFHIEYYTNSKLHRIGSPAKYTFYLNGSKCEEKYYVNDKKHRTNGPAYIKWNEHGNMTGEIYYINRKLHRTGGPAIVGWRENGNKYLEEYYLCGQQHRIGGPASIKWDDDRNIVKEEYYLTDDQYEKEEYYDLIKNIEFIL